MKSMYRDDVKYIYYLLQNQYGILSDLAMPLCITAINSFTPFVFSLVDYIEKYKNPRVSLILSMLRSVSILYYSFII